MTLLLLRPEEEARSDDGCDDSIAAIGGGTDARTSVVVIVALLRELRADAAAVAAMTACSARALDIAQSNVKEQEEGGSARGAVFQMPLFLLLTWLVENGERERKKNEPV